MSADPSKIPGVADTADAWRLSALDGALSGFEIYPEPEPARGLGGLAANCRAST